VYFVSDKESCQCLCAFFVHTSTEAIKIHYNGRLLCCKENKMNTEDLKVSVKTLDEIRHLQISDGAYYFNGYYH
jgi:hypothetical protein